MLFRSTNYFTAEEATIVVIGLCLFLLFCVALFIKGPRYQGKTHKIVVVAENSFRAITAVAVDILDAMDWQLQSQPEKHR